MRMNEYQDDAESTAVYPKHRGLEYTALGLAGEAGEYANKVKKIVRGDDPYPTRRPMVEGNVWEMADELGDVLWYVAMAARELNVSLEQVAQRNLAKLALRKENGVLRGKGDNR
jgi:NTP pyrophosphatase (non-canonical NTP hydrolase)